MGFIVFSLEDIYNQAKQSNPIVIYKRYGESYISNGIKLQKFLSKTEILNCSKNGDYFQELTPEEYDIFFINGWEKSCLIMGKQNSIRKLKMIEQKMKEEVNSRKNDKFIKNLKTKREFVMNKYSYYTKKLTNYINKNGKIKDN